MIELIKIKSRDNKALDTLCELTKTIWSEHFSKFLSKKQIAYMLSLLRREVIKDEINKDNFNYYFIKNDSELIGYLEMREDEGIFFISQFYILKEYRYKGYGKAAFNLAKDIVKSLKYKDVKIYPNKKDTVLLDILKSWGFYGYVKYIVYIGHDIHFDSIEMTYDLV